MIESPYVVDDVAYVDRRLGFVVFDDGECTSVEHWYDEEGDECGPEDALACVAQRGDRWWAISLLDLEAQKRH